MRFFTWMGWKWSVVIVLLIMMSMMIAIPPVVEAYLFDDLPDNLMAPENVSADFVVFGDSQGSFSYLWPVSPNFDDMLGLVNQIDVPMAFHVGDMISGETDLAMNVSSQVERFMDDIDELEIPMYPVMGNHDAAEGGWEVTKEMVFRGENTYYSFDKGHSHFIVLDAFEPDNQYRISDEQMAWLEEDLQSTTEPHIFVFVHAPLYPIGPHIDGSLDKDAAFRDQLAALLVEYGVDIVFCGHEHLYASLEYNGLMQVTTGGAGAKLYSAAEIEDLEEVYGDDLNKLTRFETVKSLHYICVSTTEDLITISACDYEGNIIDEFGLLS